MRFTRDGQCILVSAVSSTLKLFDKTTGELLQEFSGHINKDYRYLLLIHSGTNIYSYLYIQVQVGTYSYLYIKVQVPNLIYTLRYRYLLSSIHSGTGTYAYLFY